MRVLIKTHTDLKISSELSGKGIVASLLYVSSLQHKTFPTNLNFGANTRMATTTLYTIWA
jgi:hypothetical protein